MIGIFLEIDIAFILEIGCFLGELFTVTINGLFLEFEIFRRMKGTTFEALNIDLSKN
jgi:hypothetical protein